MAEYSKEKLYFLKLPADFFQGHKMRILESMPAGKEYELIYLKLICESVSHNGYLRFSKDMPYSEEMIAAITGASVQEVKAALIVLEKLELLEKTQDDSIYLPEVPKMTGFITEGAEKKRLQRETKGGQRVDKCLPAADSDDLEGDIEGGTVVHLKGGTTCPPEIRDKSLESRVKSLDVTTDYANASSSVTPIKPDKTRYKQFALLEILVDSGFISWDEVDDGWDDELDYYVQRYGFVDTKIKVKYFLSCTCQIQITGEDKMGKPIFGRRYEDEGQIANKLCYFDEALTKSFTKLGETDDGGSDDDLF